MTVQEARQAAERITEQFSDEEIGMFLQNNGLDVIVENDVPEYHRTESGEKFILAVSPEGERMTAVDSERLESWGPSVQDRIFGHPETIRITRVITSVHCYMVISIHPDGLDPKVHLIHVLNMFLFVTQCGERAVEEGILAESSVQGIPHGRPAVGEDGVPILI
jgi:hypothetical protein